jgi:hypothetical protein
MFIPHVHGAPFSKGANGATEKGFLRRQGTDCGPDLARYRLATLVARRPPMTAMSPRISPQHFRQHDEPCRGPSENRLGGQDDDLSHSVVAALRMRLPLQQVKLKSDAHWQKLAVDDLDPIVCNTVP